MKSLKFLVVVLVAIVSCTFSLVWADGNTETNTDTMRVNTLIVKDAKIDKAEIQKAEIELAKIRKALIRKAKIKDVEVRNLKVQMAEFEKAHFEYACMKQAEVDTLKVRLAEIETANIQTANIEMANINVANVGQLNGKGGGYVKPTSLPCTDPPCGNRSKNPNWHKTGESTLGEFALIYGWNDQVKGTKIQSKIHNNKKGGSEIQVVVTNWDGVKDISARINHAYAGARELRNKNISPNCGQSDCYVCEH
ncbi:MAG: hypothetical protein NTY33_00745 [Candidatus Moranbacteria bacterium]|nr:hypothetical protein [Candidatus Moranbacteria bacterium]